MGLKINGSTSGSIEIDVPAVAGTDTSITIPATSGGEFIVSDSAGDVNIDSGTFFVDSSTNRCGIGTTSPSANLHVQVAGDEAIRASATGANQGIWARYLAGSPHDVDLYVGSDGAAGGSFGPGGAVVWNAGNTSLSFGTNNAQRMRIDSDGLVRCGNDLNRAKRDANSVGMKIATSHPQTALEIETATGGTRYNIRFWQGSTEQGRIETGSGSTTYATSSDYRLKENIVPVTDGIERLQQLNPSRFNFIAHPSRTVDGFLAHEVQDIVPEAISGEKDAVEVWQEGEELPDGVSIGDNKLDEDGNTIPKYQGIDQSKLVPLLTAALQEAIGKIETLETANASLEARLTALEGGAS